MKVDLTIKNGSVVFPEGIRKGLGIAVKGGEIVEICKGELLPEADKVINAQGYHVLPGLMDLHVHTREPGYEHKETLQHCTTGAAVGGITMIGVMFNVNPPITNPANLQVTIERGEKNCLVNFGAWSIVVEDNIDQIAKLADAGVLGYKFLIGYAADVSGRPDVKGMSCPDDGGLLEAMEEITKTGLPLIVHTENDKIIAHAQRKLRAEGRKDPMAHLPSRPAIGEEEAMNRMITFTREKGNKLLILHMALGKGAQLVREAQREGLQVFAETCPQYLLLTNDDMKKLGSIMKINPPIRNKEDMEALWEGIKHGGVDTIGSDHSPHTPEEKMTDKPYEDIWKAMAGFVGVETSAPLMLTAVNEGRMSLERYVELASVNPAKLCGLYPRKGSLEVGTDADITIVDLNKTGQIKSSELHSKTNVTPFDGWKVKGMVSHTIVNGKVIYEEGKIVGKPGDGKFVSSKKN